MGVQRVAAYLELTTVSRVMVSEGLSETVAEFRALLAKQQCPARVRSSGPAPLGSSHD